MAALKRFSQSPIGARSIRTRVLFWSLVLVAVSVAGSGMALLRVSQINESVNQVNRIAVPLGRLYTQMQADSDALRREQERNLGSTSSPHIGDSHWRPRPIPAWIMDVLTHEIGRARELASYDADQVAELEKISKAFTEVRAISAALLTALEGKSPEVEKLRSKMVYLTDQWRRDVQLISAAHEKSLAVAFTHAERHLSEVETGLEILLVATFLLSILSFWNARSALGPLAQLSRYARELAERGLPGGDRLNQAYPDLPLQREDEIGALAREMKSMAISLKERVRAEEAARDRLKSAEHLAAIGRMSAQVAHEVRNPLHSIGLEAELAFEATASFGGANAERARESIQAILRSVDRLEKITGNYLKMSRISQGRRTPVDLADILEAVLATYSAVFQAQNVKIDWKLIGTGPYVVEGERELLENALGNLIRNSLQALEGIQVATSEDSGGFILIELARLPGGSISLTVSDNGPGVSKDVRDRLFTPFVTTRTQGTGLGLSFVKKVAEDHGGAVRLVDGANGAGAKFEVKLPAMDVRKAGENEVALL